MTMSNLPKSIKNTNLCGLFNLKRKVCRSSDSVRSIFISSDVPTWKQALDVRDFQLFQLLLKVSDLSRPQMREQLSLNGVAGLSRLLGPSNSTDSQDTPRLNARIK